MHRLIRWFPVAAAAALLSPLACGGKVVVDGNPGSGGSGGSGGNGGNGGTTSSVSSSDSVSSSVSSTVSVSVSSSVTTGTGGGCPMPFPGVEAHCDIDGQMCNAPLGCCGGQVICKGGFWSYTGALCNMPCTLPCGPNNFACQVGAVCVAYIGKTTTYQCEPDPCNGMLNCGCAEQLCEQQPIFKCNNVQDGFKVLCDCQGQC
jgi:hypothetical protein